MSRITTTVVTLLLTTAAFGQAKDDAGDGKKLDKQTMEIKDYLPEIHGTINYLKTYLLDNDFYTFTIKSLEHYKLSLEAEIASTGGFMIFAHFINTDYNNEYLLILTINNKNGYVLNENDLTIKDAKSLDLNKVDVACLINLTKWKNIESGLDTESKTYLSFVKGKKDVSYYFLSFIDCDNKQTGSI